MDISYGGVIGPRLRKEMPDGIEQMRVLPRRSWKLIAITAGFLLFKDAHSLAYAFGRHGTFERIMEGVWILVAIGLLVAFIGEFFGSEIFVVEHGELIIKRGIGPLQRTYRYAVTGIRELVSSDPTDKNGRRHVGNIFFRPKAGAVRFEYGGKTRYFADWLDESEGAKIVQWLRAKLPRTATEPLPVEQGGAANFRP